MPPRSSAHKRLPKAKTPAPGAPPRAHSPNRSRAVAGLPSLPALAYAYHDIALSSSHQQQRKNASSLGSRQRVPTAASSIPMRHGTAATPPPTSAVPPTKPQQQQQQPTVLPPLKTSVGTAPPPPRQPLQTAGDRRREVAIDRTAHVLAIRISTMMNREERVERAELERLEKVAAAALQRLFAVAKMHHTYNAAAGPSNQAPDSALASSPQLAQGSPARARRLNGGVGLGIGGLVNVQVVHQQNRSPSPRNSSNPTPTTTATSHDTPASRMYRAHDLRTRHSKIMASNAHYDHPVAAGARVDLIIVPPLNYEIRLVMVKEHAGRSHIESEWIDTTLTLIRNEEAARKFAMERSKSLRASANNAKRMWKAMVTASVDDALLGALAQMETNYEVAVEFATNVLAKAVRKHRYSPPAADAAATPTAAP